MRATLLIAISFILPCLACPGTVMAIGPAPTLTLALSPATLDVTTNGTESLAVQFNGTATVQKGRFDRNTYTLSLAAAVHAGWVCTVTPAELSFAESGSQEFICTVTIPPGTGSQTETLTVDGNLRGGGFGVTGHASAQINHEPAAGTDRPVGASQTTRTGGGGTLMFGYIAASVGLMAGAASLVYLKFFRKRKVS